DRHATQLRKDVRLQDVQLAGPCRQFRRANCRRISRNRRGYRHPLDSDDQGCPNSANVERVVEKVVIRQDPQCLQKLEQASRLISTATERLTQQYVESVAPIVLAQVPETGVFLTMAEVERALICL